MGIELYNDGKHVCIAFYDLVDDEQSHTVQSNQFIIVDNGRGAIVDPGGNLTYNGLRMGMQKFCFTDNVDFLLASHADPDIIASLNKWLIGSKAKVMISQIWSRFVPHFTNGRDLEDRIIGIPDVGAVIPLGNSNIKAIPAHFLHSEGNFQFYDPVSRILFSGDMGASLVDNALAARPVEDFKAHLPSMEGFHRRYMVSNKVCRLWVNMVRGMDVESIVPQHGRAFKGRAMVNQFLDWIEQLECGVDLMTQEHYRVPNN